MARVAWRCPARRNLEHTMNQRLARSKSSIPAIEATPVEQVYFAWDDALSRNDKEALLALYAPDAVIESPLIPHVLKVERGVVHGHKEIQRLLDEVAARKPPARKFHRTGYLTDGKRLIWEYPRE